MHTYQIGVADMENDPDLFLLPGHVIRRLHQQSAAVFQDRMKRAGHDLTSVQFAALVTLEKEPGVDQATLAKRIAYDRATIGGVIKRLVEKGLVARRPSDVDRRAFVLDLTPSGRALMLEVSPLVHALQADILRGLTAQEQEQLVALVVKALSKPTGG